MSTKTKLHHFSLWIGILTATYSGSAAAQSQVKEVDPSEAYGHTSYEIESAAAPANGDDQAISNESMVGTESSRAFDKVKYKYDPLLEQPARNSSQATTEDETLPAESEDDIVLMSSSESVAQPYQQAPADTLPNGTPGTTPLALSQKAPAAAAQPMVAMVPAASGCSCPCSCKASTTPQRVPQVSPAPVANLKAPKVACAANQHKTVRVLYAKKGKHPLYKKPGGTKVGRIARGDHFLPGEGQSGWVEVPGRGWVREKDITTKPVGRLIAKHP